MSEPVQFGRYQLIRPVGAGGMAEVHLARQVGPQGYVKPCVVKRIAKEHASSPSIRAMFMDEARVSALLTHPHIVQTLDFGEQDGVPYLALELVDGMNLAVLCRGLASLQRWIPLRASLELVAQVCDALWYAHNLAGLDGRPLNLVHRDVSPQNVLVSRQGGVKLADFGIARHDARQELTQGIQAKGKPGYMAPEQAMGQGVDARADLFAVGIVLAELVSARRVVRGEPGLGVLHAQKRVRELCSSRKDVQPELLELALSLTALEPEERPANARLVAEKLRELAHGLPPKDMLQAFLDRVFSRYFPPEDIANNTIEDPEASFARVGPSSGARRLDTSAARMPSDATELAPPRPELELPAPPESGPAEPADVRDVWGQPTAELEQPAAAISGWPKELLDDLGLPALRLPRATDAPPSAAAPPPAPTAQIVAPALSPVVPAKAGRHRYGEEIDLGRSNTGDLPDLAAPPPKPAAEPPPPAASAAPAPPLKLPLPSPAPPVAGYDPLAALAAERTPSRGSARKPIRRYNEKLIFGSLGGVVLLGLVLAIALSSRGSKAPAVAAPGTLKVRSTPEGATVLINGRELGTTPASLTELPVGVPMRVAVAMRGFVATRPEAVAQVPPGGEAVVDFVLVAARNFRIETDPPGASVTLDGKALKQLTPLELPPIPRGESATVTVALERHVSRRIVLTVSTASVTQLVLERAKRVDIVTNPANARIFVNDLELGASPQNNVDVPSAAAFTVRAERPGFKKLKKSFNGKNLEDGAVIELTLQDLPLTSLPMSREEREVAKGLERAVTRARETLFAARAELKRAEADLDRILKVPQSNVDVGARAQNRVERARGQLDAAESAHDEALGAVDAFRDGILTRIGSP